MVIFIFLFDVECAEKLNDCAIGNVTSSMIREIREIKVNMFKKLNEETTGETE